MTEGENIQENLVEDTRKVTRVNKSVTHDKSLTKGAARDKIKTSPVKKKPDKDLKKPRESISVRRCAVVDRTKTLAKFMSEVQYFAPEYVTGSVMICERPSENDYSGKFIVQKCGVFSPKIILLPEGTKSQNIKQTKVETADPLDDTNGKKKKVAEPKSSIPLQKAKLNARLVSIHSRMKKAASTTQTWFLLAFLVNEKQGPTVRYMEYGGGFENDRMTLSTDDNNYKISPIVLAKVAKAEALEKSFLRSPNEKIKQKKPAQKELFVTVKPKSLLFSGSNDNEQHFEELPVLVNCDMNSNHPTVFSENIRSKLPPTHLPQYPPTKLNTAPSVTNRTSPSRNVVCHNTSRMSCVSLSYTQAGSSKTVNPAFPSKSLHLQPARLSEQQQEVSVSIEHCPARVAKDHSPQLVNVEHYPARVLGDHRPASTPGEHYLPSEYVERLLSELHSPAIVHCENVEHYQARVLGDHRPASMPGVHYLPSEYVENHPPSAVNVVIGQTSASARLSEEISPARVHGERYQARVSADPRPVSVPGEEHHPSRASNDRSPINVRAEQSLPSDSGDNHPPSVVTSVVTSSAMDVVISQTSPPVSASTMFNSDSEEDLKTPEKNKPQSNSKQKLAPKKLLGTKRRLITPKTATVGTKKMSQNKGGIRGNFNKKRRIVLFGSKVDHKIKKNVAAATKAQPADNLINDQESEDDDLSDYELKTIARPIRTSKFYTDMEIENML